MESDSVNIISARPMTTSSEVSSAEAAQATVNRRPSTPEFPFRPSPDVPPWLSKCLKLLTMCNEGAQEELGRMLDEALERKERQGQEDLGSATLGTSGAKKIDIRPIAGSPKVTPLQAKPSAGGLKMKSLTEKLRTTPPVKRVRSPTPPPVVRISSPEYSGTTVTIPDDVFVNDGRFAGTSGDGDTDLILSDLFANDISCVICGHSTESGENMLLNCQTCRDNFHQLCHNPVVTGVDASDPRLVWYCSSCGKKTAKPAESSSTAALSPVTTIKSKSTTASKNVVSSAPPSLFQRLDSKPSVSTTLSTGTTGGGLAGLAKLKTLGQGPVASKSDKPVAKRARFLDPTKLPPTPPKN